MQEIHKHPTEKRGVSNHQNINKNDWFSLRATKKPNK